MPENENTATAVYPKWIGFVFIFNLIVGTGALTLPGVFAKVGWLLSLLVITLLALISYMTVTFVIESMAATNAVKNWQNLQALNRSQGLNEGGIIADNDDDELNASLTRETEAELERMPLTAQHSSLYYYRLNQKYELGEMATLFFNDFGRILFYLCFAIYLYGDLSIYSAAIAKSLRDLVCMERQSNATNDNNNNFFLWQTNSSADAQIACWPSHTLSRLHVYRLFLIGFTLIFGPFAAFSIHKTKYLQLLTVVFRWLAFIFMIGIAIKMLLTDGAKGRPVAMNFYGMPTLFGACVYSFMCHHSLPSLLAPLRDKLSVGKILAYDYFVICAFYILLAMTGIFAFEHIKDLYTLNFIPSATNGHSFSDELLVAIDYFLALFPIFTLSTSYPIIAITLRNNLQCLFLDMTRFESYNIFARRILFPICAICPPFVITYFTESLTSLVAFTGSYAGTGIQYVIPVALVYFARRTCKELLGSGVVNHFQSPFVSNYWLVFVLIWCAVCVCLVSINFFI